MRYPRAEAAAEKIVLHTVTSKDPEIEDLYGGVEYVFDVDKARLALHKALDQPMHSPAIDAGVVVLEERWYCWMEVAR